MVKENKLQRLGKNIAKYRHEHGISQDDFAYKADIGRRTLARIETGETDPKFSTLVKIADALQVKLKDLVSLE